MVTASCNAVI